MAGAEVDVLDVVVVGDGPAGLALGAACGRAGLRVAVAGEGRPWSATYGAWRDDVDGVPDTCFAQVAPSVLVFVPHRLVVERAYVVLDNAALRDYLAAGVDVVDARALGVQHFTWGSRVLTSGEPLDAKLVVDAAGSGGLGGRLKATERRAQAGQTAFGVVVAEPPEGIEAGAPTLMDLRPVGGSGPASAPTFAYAVPLAGGWLLEETVLAGRPLGDPTALRGRLIRRLGPNGEQVVDGALRTETVTIPMGGPIPTGREPVVRFGAAAGYVHPATGYSVAASLRAAPRVAAAIAAATTSSATDVRRVWPAVWSSRTRRTRRLHDYGLEVLLGLDQRELAEFFAAFFGDLSVARWAGYLRFDTPPAQVSATMALLFARLPWRVRRRLVVRPGGR